AAGIPGLSFIGATSGLASLGSLSGLALLGLNPITAGVVTLLLLGGGSAWLTGKLLRRQQKDINAQDEHGRTPLHQAAQEGQAEAVKVLIEAGAQLNVKDKAGAYPQGLGCSSQSRRCLNLLTEAELACVGPLRAGGVSPHAPAGGPGVPGSGSGE
ncbi:MAG: ankyrin repeat domain-containing protein, partial [Synechococcus sp. SB0673_bin_10]|nr:ankyrin repeat domain-containing protein [Synechococcus sp. SB0667_bin_8]MYI71108.1 ankyrin repeat domain-containing protein [Synechococcus sp. SB0673_bin_10]